MSSPAHELPELIVTQPSRVGRNVSVLALGQLITWTMTLLWTFVVPRALGPSGLGVVMSAWSICGIFGILLGLGTKNYLVRTALVEPDAAPGRIGTTIVARTLLSPLVFAAAFAYGQLAHWNGNARVVLVLAAAATVLVQLAEPLQAGFQATERMEYLAYSDIISKSGQGLVGIIVVLLGAGAIGVTACMAAMAAVVIALDVYWIRGHVRVDIRTNVRAIARVTRESVPYWAFGVFFMIYLWIDFVMLSLMTHADVVGWYGVPTRLFQTLMFLPVVVATAWLPRFVRGHEAGGDELLRVARQPTELVLLISLPIGAMCVVAAHPIVHFLYGPAYDHAIPVMALLGLSIPPMYLSIMLSQVLIGMGRQGAWTWVMVATTIVNPLFNLVLIPATQHRYGNGAIGAAIALFLTELVALSIGMRLVGRGIFDRSSVWRTALAVGISVAMCVAGIGAQHVAGDIAGLAAATAVCGLLVYLTPVFTPDEIELIKVGLGKIQRKLPGLKRFAPTPAADAQLPS